MSLRIFVLDNYDSFTFNLVQYLGELGAAPDVVRNDEIDVEGVAARSPDAVVISPGPGVPRDAGISLALVEWCESTSTPLLGVCLGHQVIAEAYGARVVAAPVVVHGKTSQIHHDGRGVYEDIVSPFEATRYHSLVVDRPTLVRELVLSAWTNDGIVMGVRHCERPIEGVQFHPEAVLTGAGMSLLKNFVRSATAIRRR